jgi:acetate---CoA ligase (ADP-forming)
MAVSPSQVHKLLNPTSIALVGASDESNWSVGFMRNLESFKGEVHLVNPNRESAFGRICHPSVSAVRGPVDHAAVLVPARAVLGVLSDCAAAGVTSATVVASGFAEAGPDGDRLGDALREFAAGHGIALIGPNCYGFNNYAGSGTYLSRYFVDVPPVAGNVGLIFQSGQLGASGADAAFVRGVKLRYVISSGNELVVNANDYFDYFIESPEIAVMGGVVERIAEPERFARIARRAAEAGKPIVLLKMGRSAAATRIARAHTGSITGSDAIADAFLKELGVIRVDSVEELAETVGLLAAKGWPKGPRAAFLGFSGGSAELFADQADKTSIVLDPHPPQRLRALAEASTLDESAIHNPFDMTVDGGFRYSEIAAVLAQAPDLDILVSQGQPLRAEGEDTGWASLREPHTAALARATSHFGKYTVQIDGADVQPGKGVIEVEVPNGGHYVLGHNGVRAIGHAIDYGTARARLLARGAAPDFPVDTARLPPLTSGPLSETDSKSLLRAYGIPVTEDLVAHTAQEAAEAAGRLGFPVVLKVLSAELPHKSDVGGVVLGLKDSDSVKAAFDAVSDRIRALPDDVHLEGVLVSRQVTGAHEFIAGITSDPHVGPMVVAGLGGVYVEVLRDVVLATPGLTQERATELLGGLRSAPILAGTRGNGPLDVSAFADVLCRLGQIARDHRDEILELDINPLFVLPEGQGVIAADALVILRDAPGSSPAHG